MMYQAPMILYPQLFQFSNGGSHISYPNTEIVHLSSRAMKSLHETFSAVFIPGFEAVYLEYNSSRLTTGDFKTFGNDSTVFLLTMAFQRWASGTPAESVFRCRMMFFVIVL